MRGERIEPSSSYVQFHTNQTTRIINRKTTYNELNRIVLNNMNPSHTAIPSPSLIATEKSLPVLSLGDSIPVDSGA